MAKYLITGGDGYLAQQVINRLVQSGHQVRAIDVKFDQLEIALKYKHLLDKKCFSLSNKELLLKAFEGVDVCIHLASPTSESLNYDIKVAATLEGLHVFFAA